MGHAQQAVSIFHFQRTINREAQHPTFMAGSLLAQNRFNALFASGRRYCQHVPAAPDPAGYYRTVLVVEGEAGYFDLAVFTKDLGRAERDASTSNQRRGLTEDDAVHIVCSSIKAQINRTKKG
jgi:hypothetical protein